MGSHLTPVYDVLTAGGWAELTRHAPGSHVASLRLHVYSECRGKGHGRDLVLRAIYEAVLRGIRRVEATPYVDNPAAMEFFNRLAPFKHEGYRRAGGCRDGQLVDTHLYAWVDA